MELVPGVLAASIDSAAVLNGDLATTCRWRICHKAACQALWVYASIQYLDVPLFMIF